MTPEILRTLITGLYEGKKEREEYLNEVPNDLQTIFIDNKYINSLEDTILKALKVLMTPEDVEDIVWFLYEWKPGYTIQTWEKEYVINSLNDFIDYIIENTNDPTSAT